MSSSSESSSQRELPQNFLLSATPFSSLSPLERQSVERVFISKDSIAGIIYCFFIVWLILFYHNLLSLAVAILHDVDALLESRKLGTTYAIDAFDFIIDY